jgi:hypothetical protein
MNSTPRYIQIKSNLSTNQIKNMLIVYNSLSFNSKVGFDGIENGNKDFLLIREFIRNDNLLVKGIRRKMNYPQPKYHLNRLQMNSYKDKNNIIKIATYTLVQDQKVCTIVIAVHRRRLHRLALQY